MKILVINCGSSSLKYQLMDMETEVVIAKGNCERIGMLNGNISYQAGNNEKMILTLDIPDHKKALTLILDKLTDSNTGVINSLNEIEAVGHRVVHGGEKFTSSVIITDDVIQDIEDCCKLAPLHNPANLMGINACKKLVPNAKMAAIFDTAFHQTMPEKAYIYGIPYKYYEKHAVRRYGFHGTSHKYVSERAAKILGKDIENSKIIVCHLGNGSSICAVKNGKSVDTSMGFTPLEGLIMGTRSGDIDPAILQYIAELEQIHTDEVVDILNKHSGVKGISNLSSDFRDLVDSAAMGNELAELALDAYAYRVGKYIGSYVAVMGGVDAIVFTAGIGEKDVDTRIRIFEYIKYLGISINNETIRTRGKEAILSTPDSNVCVMTIPTEEELTIARETRDLFL
jgi:acetate kinase